MNPLQISAKMKGTQPPSHAPKLRGIKHLHESPTLPLPSFSEIATVQAVNVA